MFTLSTKSVVCLHICSADADKDKRYLHSIIFVSIDSNVIFYSNIFNIKFKLYFMPI